MRRAILLGLGIVAFTWLEFEFVPGHSYLQSGTQIYLPSLERLDTPGYLSRDLVATHPHFTYTIYDEVTLFLHKADGMTLEKALIGQQFLCRAAAILGVFLLAISAGLSDPLALLAAVLLNLGAALAGPAVRLVAYEPTPSGFAFGLVLLAMGLLAREKPLLAGLAGGMALVYHPATAGPFWVPVLLAFILDRRLRSLLRPALTILIVFVLLLANLAQLQPGVGDPQPFFGKLTPQLAALQQYRTKFVWVSLWAGTDLWHYLAIWVCGMWAAARLWPILNRQMRWFLLTLPTFGILSLPLSDLLLEHLRWSLISHAQPARTLLFTVALASLACALAGLRAAVKRKTLEACLWLFVVFALPINTRVLDFLRLSKSIDRAQLLLCVALACGLALALRQIGTTKWRAAVLLFPVAAMFAIPKTGVGTAKMNETPIREVADWAEANTWGSSMFLFPDAGRERYPGIFRAESRRALWVDWESGELVDYFESAGEEWWRRWEQTMQGAYSPERLESDLPLPIDYYVLKRSNRLVGIRPVFANKEFVVYDSRDLRNASAPLKARIAVPS